MYEARRQGLEEGIEKGEKESKLKIAKKLLEKKMEIKEIAEITGLKEEEIENLKDNQNIGYTN